VSQVLRLETIEITPSGLSPTPSFAMHLPQDKPFKHGKIEIHRLN